MSKSASGVILDLDDTLVDTRALATARANRDWKGCVRRFDETTLYPGIVELLQTLHDREIAVAILTTSVSFYAERLLEHHSLGPLPLVHYHSVQPNIKPHPAGVHLAAGMLKLNPSECIGVGDRRTDQEAYNAAGALAFGAGWTPYLESASWDLVLQAPHLLLASLSSTPHSP